MTFGGSPEKGERLITSVAAAYQLDFIFTYPRSRLAIINCVWLHQRANSREHSIVYVKLSLHNRLPIYFIWMRIKNELIDIGYFVSRSEPFRFYHVVRSILKVKYLVLYSRPESSPDKHSMYKD